MKKIFSILFCVAIILTGLCSCLSSGMPVTDDKYFTFTEYEDGYAIAAATLAEYPKNIKLPAEHNGKKVIAVKSEGFKNCQNLEKVVIPAGYKLIGDGAFEGLKNLHNVSISDIKDEGSLTVGYRAFADCVALTEVSFGKAVKNVGAYAFKNTRILRVEFSAVETLGDYAFKDCVSLTYVYIPETLKAGGIGKEAPFYGCKDDVDFVIHEHAKLNAITVAVLTGSQQ